MIYPQHGNGRRSRSYKPSLHSNESHNRIAKGSHMSTTVRLATADEKAVVMNMDQYYLYEFSKFLLNSSYSTSFRVLASLGQPHLSYSQDIQDVGWFTRSSTIPSQRNFGRKLSLNIAQRISQLLRKNQIALITCTVSSRNCSI